MMKRPKWWRKEVAQEIHDKYLLVFIAWTAFMVGSLPPFRGKLVVAAIWMGVVGYIMASYSTGMRQAREFYKLMEEMKGEIRGQLTISARKEEKLDGSKIN